MQVKNNQEIKNYTESVFFGLSMRQCFFSALACVVTIFIYFISIERLGMEFTSWLCILGAVPFAALGFIQFQFMNAEEIALHLWRSYWLKKTDLIDQPTHLYLSCVQSILEKEKKEAVKKHDKKLR